MTDQADGSSDPVDLGKRDAGRPQDATQQFGAASQFGAAAQLGAGSTPGDGHPSAPEDDPDFDPYRFGAPEHPVPPEYAPPGYKPPQQPAGPTDPYSPYGSGSPYGNGSPYGPPAQPSPYGPPPQSPYGPPLQSPYGPPLQSPYGPPPGYQQGGYQHGGYPQPGGGAFDGPPQGNGKAVTSLVLGILSILLCWTVYLDALIIIPGFVFGVIVLSNRSSRSRGLAWAGVICSAVGAVLAIVLTVVALHLASNCQDLSGSDLRQCVSNQL